MSFASCSKINYGSNIDEEMRTDGDKRCKWRNCDYIANNLDELSVHVHGHLCEGRSSEKAECFWQECKKTGKLFSNKRNLKRHFETEHIGKTRVFAFFGYVFLNF